jgi:UDP-N-acetylmuramoylalanine--D-glutamate ligase
MSKAQNIIARDYTLVVGMGITGTSVVRHLVRKGVPANDIMVVDSREAPPSLAEFKKAYPQITVKTGAFNDADFTHATSMIVSPGVALAEPAIQKAIRQGVPALGDIELFAQEAHAPVIAITGSNGKSTVTTLVGEMAKRAGLNVGVGGNLGTAALDLLNENVDLYVLELSSFQLETTHNLRPVAAVVLNISADHMDRYNSLEQYSAAKQHIYDHCKVAVINRDDERVRAMVTAQKLVSGFTLHSPRNQDFGLCEHQGEAWLCKGTQKLLAESELKIGGRHNTANALAALALGEAASLPMDDMLHSLRDFTGLPHRTQWVAEKQGVIWYNDSKGTNVGATEAAIAGLLPPAFKTGGKLILILGGQGKGQDFSPLKSAVQNKVRRVVLIGEDASKIEHALAGVVPVSYATDMHDAVQQCAQSAHAGDAVLLSPACASFDMYRGYTHRGEVFMREVEALA